MKRIKNIAICFALICSTTAFGQNPTTQTEQKKIKDYFDEHTNTKLFPDTNRMYTFAFKVRVIKNKKGGYMVDPITANDPIAYTLFPSFLQLKNIDYSVFLKNESEATLILPVVLDVWKDTWPEPAKKVDERELLSKAFGLTDPVAVGENRIYLPPIMAWYKLTTYY